MLPDFRSVALYVCAVLLVVLGLSTWIYRSQAKASTLALATQSAAIVRRNLDAAALLKMRTAERDVLQKTLNARAEAQEKTDEKAVAQIDTDDKRQRGASVRVRMLNCTRDARSGGGGAPGGSAATADAGAADAGAAGGVLPEAGARRLADALTEIEATSVAYSSCRATMMPK